MDHRNRERKDQKNSGETHEVGPPERDSRRTPTLEVFLFLGCQPNTGTGSSSHTTRQTGAPLRRWGTAVVPSGSSTPPAITSATSSQWSPQATRWLTLASSQARDSFRSG